MNITRQQADDLTAFIATMTPLTDAEQALVDRATSNPTQVTGDILTTPNTVAATATEGTVDTYDLFTPAQLANAGTNRKQETSLNTVPHPYTVATTPEGRETDWTHPTDCPDGDTCDIKLRAHRLRLEEMAELADGRPDGTYLLGRYGFHGLLLIDEHGNPLPDVVEALSPTSAAARRIVVDVIRELSEPILEDPDIRERFEVIRRGSQMDQWELDANQAIDGIISEFLGPMHAYAEPIRALSALECPECGRSVSGATFKADEHRAKCPRLDPHF